MARAAGSVLLEWDAPQNAAPGSIHYCTVYDLGSLPFGVDWHLWPHEVRRPVDSKPLYERSPSVPSDLTFEGIQERATETNRGRSLPEMPGPERSAFRLSMLYPICKDLVRGWPQSSALMVEWLGFEIPSADSESWDAILHSILDALAAGFSPKVRQKYENLLEATSWVMNQRS